MACATVTALMTTYNSSRYVGAAIDSVLAQTFDDFQLLIVDDGSTDNTCDTIQGYTDPRIRLIQQVENRGVGATLQHALNFVDTPYIAKIDSDDICLPQRFAKQYQFLQQQPQTDIVKCYFRYFADNDEVANSERYQYFKTVKEAEHNSINSRELIHQQLLRWNCMIHSSYFAKTSVVKAVNYLPLRVGEDYSLFYRAVLAGYQISCVPEYLLQMRVSNVSVTSTVQSACHFADALMQLKLAKITYLANRHQSIKLYGTGALARAVAEKMLACSLPFAGFIEQQCRESIEIGDKSWPVQALAECAQKGIVIAAQPVRNQIVKQLLSLDWREWQDFMVLA